MGVGVHSHTNDENWHFSMFETNSTYPFFKIKRGKYLV